MRRMYPQFGPVARLCERSGPKAREHAGNDGNRFRCWRLNLRVAIDISVKENASVQPSGIDIHEGVVQRIRISIPLLRLEQPGIDGIDRAEAPRARLVRSRAGVIQTRLAVAKQSSVDPQRQAGAVRQFPSERPVVHSSENGAARVEDDPHRSISASRPANTRHSPVAARKQWPARNRRDWRATQSDRPAADSQSDYGASWKFFSDTVHDQAFHRTPTSASSCR